MSVMHGNESGSAAPGEGRQPRGELPAGLLPVAPILYVVWSDGGLSTEEMAAVRHRARQLPGLDDAGREALSDWLDPEQPPSAEELATLLQRVETAAGGDDAFHTDLAELGTRLAAPGVGSWADPESLRAALDELQAALGLPAGEAAGAMQDALATPPQRRARRWRRGRRSPASSTTTSASGEPAPLDANALYEFLDGDHLALRREVLRLLQQPEFDRVSDRDSHAYREAVLRWCTLLAGHGYGALAFPREFGGVHDASASIAVFETLAYHDLSLLVKYGVQFGLFAGSIYLLGTRSHHQRFLRAAAHLELPGCFAMTETGHGSNVRELQTTAEYDVDSGEFVVHTPTPQARKDYIGNAALHGRLAVVFAQLVTPTGRHGVHAFLVPIRDDAGNAAPGVSIEDCGLKVGLNGVDNGRLSFDRVRIPRENLLDRYGSVSAGGAYSSPIPSAGRRFFTMLGTLVAGRISIACASLSAGKSGLVIAVRYAAARRQFGPEGGPEVPILDYTVVQRALLGRVATAYALDAALKELVRRFAAAGTEGSQELETLAAALKAYASEWTVGTLQAAREACGGQGYLAENRLGRLRADTDVFTTFEGANDVLYQLVAKGRLTEYRHQFGELRVWNVARYLGARAATRVTELNPIVTRRTDTEHLMDPDFHAAALQYREERLVASLARRLKRRIDSGMDGFDALNECQDHAVEVGRAFAERFLLEQFQAAVARAPAALRAPLAQLAALYALDRVEARAAWYLEAGYAETGKIRAIRKLVNDLCAEVRPSANALVDAFGIPDPLIGAPIATGGPDGESDAAPSAT